MKALGTFGKGVEGSKSINFSDSASENCSNRCKLKNNGCYAERIEKIYSAAKKSGISKKKLGPVQICNKAITELRYSRNIPWVRFSVLGSLPMIAKANKAKGFKESFNNLLSEIELAVEGNTLERVHIPVETKEKAEYYQKLSNNRATIRQSCQSLEQVFETSGHRSGVVGEKGTPMKERIQKCHEVAKKLREKGNKTVVCGAVREKNYKGRKTGCGECKACGSRAVDVVLYPLH